MSLTFGPPPPELARELEQVRARAEALTRALETVNIPLPEDFPKADILAITAEMAELPDGSAQGSLQALEYVDTRLSEIRSQHVSTGTAGAPWKGDNAPPLTRDEGLDRELIGLIAAVATARRVANRLAAVEEEERTPEPSVSRQSAPGLAEAESTGKQAFNDLVVARNDFDVVAAPGSEPARDFRRTLTDAKVVTGLSRVELAQKDIIPAWLKRFGEWVLKYPARIEQAGEALIVGVDVVKTLHGGWRTLNRNLIDAVYASAHDFGVQLKNLGQRLDKRRKAADLLEPFSIAKMRAKILAGEALPEEWVIIVDELDLSGTPLRGLASLQNLTSLRRLGLRITQVADLSPLQALTGLQSLDLGSTEVADLSPLKALTSLQSLNLWCTKVADLSPLQALTGLRSLDLRSTKVADLSPLQALTGLRSLDLAFTQVADLSPLKALTGLRRLDLSYMQVADLSPLRTMTGLQSLKLSGTRVADLSPLKALTGLQSLDLLGTQVADLRPLRDMAKLRFLDIRHTKVTDASVLAHLQSLAITGPM